MESARLDGANDFRVLFSIIMPLSKAGLATIGLWVFVAHWNDYMNPLLYLRSVNKYTLQLVLREMVLTSESSSLVELIEGNRTALPEQLKHAAIVVPWCRVQDIYPLRIGILFQVSCWFRQGMRTLYVTYYTKPCKGVCP